MKCPHCDSIVHPHGKTESVNGTQVIILYCPYCQAILGAVNKPKD